ncbi:MAG: hypothetical protein ACLR6J_12565 [Parabacteroides merdae]
MLAVTGALTNGGIINFVELAIRIIRHIGITWANVACNMLSIRRAKIYRVIQSERPSLHRSSALASKATGYPLAFVAAKLGLEFTAFSI